MRPDVAGAGGQLTLLPTPPVEVALDGYDVWALGTSAGKDSAAMAAHLIGQARTLGVLHRVVAVHADLSVLEWPGTRELAERQLRELTLPGEPPIRFETVRRDIAGEEDLIGYLLRWGRWPSPAQPWCRAALKRGPVNRLFTRLADEVWQRQPDRAGPVRILNCLGLRAQESAARAKQEPLTVDGRVSSGRKEITRFLPLHSWLVDDVWAVIRDSKVTPHPAYGLGQSRASCVLCFLQRPAELVRAATLNPELAQVYELAEFLVGHLFRVDLPMWRLLELAGIPPLPRDWPLRQLAATSPADGVAAAAVGILGGDRPMPDLPDVPRRMPAGSPRHVLSTSPRSVNEPTESA